MTTWDGPAYERLEAKRIANQDIFPDDLRLRARRCTSWLERAEQEMTEDDPDAAFIFYWIAFNAAYAEGDSELRLGRREQDVFSDYFDKIIALDDGWMIYGAIWRRFHGPIEDLLNNMYVSQPFWDYHNGLPVEEPWESRFRGDLDRVDEARRSGDTKDMLLILFYRLYVLRNQLIHGGTTWKGSVNRAQVTDGAMIMAFLVPLFIELMMDNPDTPWPSPPFPLVRDSHERRQHSV